MKNIIGICGSSSQNSANLNLLKKIAELGEFEFKLEIIDDLSIFPHFKTELTDVNTPIEIMELREKIEKSDAAIICTPEYVFSIPSGLKNILEWTVSTTVFSHKPLGIITASASGEKGHEELQLIMKTLQSEFTDETTLLIQGIKGKINQHGELIDENIETQLKNLSSALILLVENRV